MSSNQDDIEWLRLAFMTPEQRKQHEEHKANTEKMRKKLREMFPELNRETLRNLKNGK